MILYIVETVILLLNINLSGTNFIVPTPTAARSEFLISDLNGHYVIRIAEITADRQFASYDALFLVTLNMTPPKSFVQFYKIQQRTYMPIGKRMFL